MLRVVGDLSYDTRNSTRNNVHTVFVLLVYEWTSIPVFPIVSKLVQTFHNTKVPPLSMTTRTNNNGGLLKLERHLLDRRGYGKRYFGLFPRHLNGKGFLVVDPMNISD
jgi:hypothetical protein